MGKRVSALDSDFQPLKLIRGLEHMTDLVRSQVKSVLDALPAHDLPAAMNVWKGDRGGSMRSVRLCSVSC